jgi:dTDP-4-dehydrorhamnose reductase
VYSGCTGTNPHSENEDRLTPVNVYGRHKLEAEKRVLDVCPDAVSLRLSWMYDMPMYRTSTNNNFTLGLIKAAIAGKAGKYSVSDFRGVTYVRSVVEHMPEAFNLPGGVYNYGSENDKNMYETACEFMTALGLTDRIPSLIISSDATQPRNLLMDCSKIREHGINFELTTEGIKKMVSDYPGLF